MTRALGLRLSARWQASWLLAVAALGVFFAADDQTSVVAVLPSMIEGLGLPQDRFYRAAWIVNGYILGYVVAMPLMGRIADTYGHARVFAAALLLFCAGSAWVALSQGLTMVSVARAFQAVGGGAVVPVAMAMVAANAPPGRRALGFGAMAAAAEGGGLIGPLWGGGIAEALGWRGVFWINLHMCLPLAAACLWLAREERGLQRRALDLPGAALAGAGLALLTVALTDDPIEGRGLALDLALYAAAATAFAAFLLRQAKAREPLLELRLFRLPRLSAAIVTSGLGGGTLIVAMVGVPLFTNAVLGGSAIEGGLTLMRLSVGLPAGALAGGYAAARFGAGPTAAAGMALAALGFAGMAAWSDDPSPAAMTLPLLTAGLGFGLTIAPVNSAALGQGGEDRRATTASLLTIARLIGALVGVALLTTRGLGGFYAEAGLVPLDDPRFEELVRGLEVDAFQEVFLVTAAVCILAVLPALVMGGRASRPE